jgi:hypothetical protein
LESERKAQGENAMKRRYQEHLRSLRAEQEAARKASEAFLDCEKLSPLYDAIQSRGTQEPEGNQQPFLDAAALQRETLSTLERERRSAMRRLMLRGPLADAVNRGEVSLFQAEFIQQTFPLQRLQWKMAREEKPRKPPGPDPLRALMATAHAVLVARGDKDVAHRYKKRRRDALRACLREHCGIEKIDDSTFQRNGF